MKRLLKFSLTVVVAAALVFVLVESNSNAIKRVNAKKPNLSLGGTVTDSQNRPIGGATVFFIDSTLVDMTQIKPADVLSGEAEAYDEPLEDLINNASLAMTLPHAVTDNKGKYKVKGLDGTLKYFAFVQPNSNDSTHIPGGDATRTAISPVPPKTSKAATKHKGLDIKLSWNFPQDATYIGTTACVSCHADQAGAKTHIHSFTFQVPGVRTATQDVSKYPWIDQFINKFTVAGNYSDKGVKVLFFESYDATQAQKYLIWEDATGGGTIVFKVYLWKTADGQHKVTMENVINKADKNNFMTLDVIMTMGGYLRQRLLVKIPGRQGAYQFFTFQGFDIASQGKNTYYDRSRRVFQEGGPGGGGVTNFFSYNTTTPTKSAIVIPTSLSSATSCAVCHMGGNTQTQSTLATGESISHLTGDPAGVFDIDGDGQPDDIGIRCESCHGPGSRHRDEAMGKSDAVVLTKGATQPANAKYIINPKLLGSDRVAIICGRCHQSASIADGAHAYPPPGISRDQFVKLYTRPDAKGPALTKLWPDGIHEVGGHEGLAYSNFIRSKHYRNSRILVTCVDCHDMHGGAKFRAALPNDPDDASSPLCQRCHERDVATHVTDKLGSPMAGASLSCTQCHMAKTGKGAAGHAGLVIGPDTSSVNNVYWQGDQTSHIWDMPTKFSRGTVGVAPGTAMPVPYINECGTCHDASKLPYQQPQ